MFLVIYVYSQDIISLSPFRIPRDFLGVGEGLDHTIQISYILKFRMYVFFKMEILFAGNY